MSILGIDIGGTKTIIGVVDRPTPGVFPNAVHTRRIEGTGSLGPERAIAAIKAACHEAIADSQSRIESIGIGCGGPMDRKTGVLHGVPNLPGWEGMCLTRIFGEEFDAPAHLDNDATAALIGQQMFGAGKGVDDFVYFTVSTGIGGGIVAGGKVYRGCGDNAGEFGHQKIRHSGPPCPCGDKGCLESFSSGTSIARAARELLPGERQTILWEWISKPEQVTAALVARAAAQGDRFARGIWDEAMESLGIGISNVVNVLNPRLVVLGGGVTNAGDLLFEPVRRVVRQRAMHSLAEDVEIVPAEGGEMVGLAGAVALAIEQEEQS